DHDVSADLEAARECELVHPVREHYRRAGRRISLGNGTAERAVVRGRGACLGTHVTHVVGAVDSEGRGRGRQRCGHEPEGRDAKRKTHIHPRDSVVRQRSFRKATTSAWSCSVRINGGGSPSARGVVTISKKSA